jgi:hypothetical protein
VDFVNASGNRVPRPAADDTRLAKLQAAVGRPLDDPIASRIQAGIDAQDSHLLCASSW